jgi:putative restriction endonuclease
MKFEDWMLHRELSPGSVKKYVGAVQGILSKWAIDYGFMEGPLTSLISRSRFEAVALQLRSLPIYQEQNERGHNMYNAALNKFDEYLSEGYDGDIEADIDFIIENPALYETKKSNLVKSRIGQGTFRQKLLSYWTACAVTGFKGISLLVASHIKPWRASSNAERMDTYNGLLLVPNLDKAFDAGLITFEANGHIKISPLLTEPEKLGITSSMVVPLSPLHEPFMNFHRTVVYRAT